MIVLGDFIQEFSKLRQFSSKIEINRILIIIYLPVFCCFADTKQHFTIVLKNLKILEK